MTGIHLEVWLRPDPLQVTHLHEGLMLPLRKRNLRLLMFIVECRALNAQKKNNRIFDTKGSLMDEKLCYCTLVDFSKAGYPTTRLRFSVSSLNIER